MRHPRISRKRKLKNIVNRAFSLQPMNFEAEVMTNEGFTSYAIQHGEEVEKKKEIAISFMNQLISGKSDVTPIVIGMKGGSIVFKELNINDDGYIELPEDIKFQTKDELLQKQRVISRIVDEIAPVLHADIESVVYLALMRKDKKRLKKVLEKLQTATKRDEKPRLTTRLGCIYLEIGNESFLL